MKTMNGSQRQHILCMSVQQTTLPKISVSPLELEDAKEPSLNLYKPKEPYTATVVSVERLVGPKAPGETCHVVIDHGGNVPYWEGQSYGVIPPVSSLVLYLSSYMHFLYASLAIHSCFKRHLYLYLQRMTFNFHLNGRIMHNDLICYSRLMLIDPCVFLIFFSFFKVLKHRIKA